MNYDEFMQVVRARRSVRTYKPDPVNDGVIKKIIEAGKWAPCGNNIQVLEVIVIKDKTLIEQIENITGQSLEPSLTQHFGAPIMLAILGDSRICEGYFKGFFREEILHSCLSVALENMLLAAAAVGLGSVWKTVAPYAAVKIKDLLGIPQFYVLKALMPLGYPKGEITTPPKNDVVVHENFFEIGKLKSEAELAVMIDNYCTASGLNKIRAF
jgi:nitroreductase